MPSTNTSLTEISVTSSYNPDKKNRSFSSQKLVVLKPVTFKTSLPACLNTTIFLHPPSESNLVGIFEKLIVPTTLFGFCFKIIPKG